MRTDVSGLHAPRHAVEIRRHADQLGYHYLYTVRPPEREPDPIGYALAIAIGVHAATLVVHDLTTVDNTPARVCEICDLETVCPPVTWARARPASIGPDRQTLLNVLAALTDSRMLGACPSESIWSERD